MLLARNSLDRSVLNEYITTIIGCIIYFSIGVHIGWTSPYIPRLQSHEYPFRMSSDAISYVAICGPIGDIIGEIASSIIVDGIGRRNTLLLGGIPLLCSFTLIYFSYISPIAIYVARILGGISMGCVLCITAIYNAEISRPRIRGKLGVLSAFAFISGLIVVNLLGKYMNFYDSSIIFGVIIVTFLVLFSMVPESPYYLLMKGRVKEAENSLVFFRRTNQVGEELTQLSEDVKRQLSEAGSFSDLFKINSNRKALLLVVAARVFQQTTGCTTFTMYAQDILHDSEHYLEPQFSIFVIYTIQALTVILSGNLSDKFGRVPLLVFSMFATFFMLGSLGLYFSFRHILPNYLPIILFGLYYILFQIGIGSLLNVLAGEFFSASIKPKAILVVNLTYSLTVIVTTKFYQVCETYFHVSVPFYVFAVCTLVGGIFIKVAFIESKGKTLELIQMELKGIVRRKSKISASI